MARKKIDLEKYPSGPFNMETEKKQQHKYWRNANTPAKIEGQVETMMNSLLLLLLFSFGLVFRNHP